MGNRRGLGINLIIISIYLVAAVCTCLGVQNTTFGCFEQERLALLKFKQSVEDEFGMLSSWIGHDCCRWERIHCDAVSGNVESVRLRGSLSYSDDERYYEFVGEGYLVGNEVDSSLADLRHLKYLDLSGNVFSHIPEFVGSLKQLSYLNLSHVDFQGIGPHHIGNLSKLKVLDLSSNELLADDVAWTSGLSSIEHLDLSSMNLSGAHNLDMFYMIPS